MRDSQYFLHLFMALIKQLKMTGKFAEKETTTNRNSYTITHFPSSSLRSYSSVKRVDVTIAFDTNVLFVTAAIFIVEVVVGGDTVILLSFLVFLLLLLLKLLLLILLKILLNRVLLYFIQIRR